MLAAMFSGRHPITRDLAGNAFIDRNGATFSHVLDFLHTGKLFVAKDDEVLVRRILEEAEYFQIDGLEHACKKQMKQLEKQSTFLNELDMQSTILSAPMKKSLRKMLPGGWRNIKCRTILTSEDGTDALQFDNTVKGVGPFLIVIRADTNFVFGAYVADTFGVPGGWIPGSRETFLFSFGDCNAAIRPVKLCHSGSGDGIFISSGCGLHLGTDLEPFFEHACAPQCTPQVYTTVDPLFSNVTLNDTTLAGRGEWQPLFTEVFAVSHS
eukprot:TRINITY_DN4125_c0_g1_i12.p2 TRINITY_DN4125_c0_g1~~TRINITY_DN4125_c0_g1_i12.p2  ORF type:complete len:267 (-),score=61.49 TRINITY_DN4125_c0_g1_i12:60-860(-)